jgi:hypothetical protein
VAILHTVEHMWLFDIFELKCGIFPLETAYIFLCKNLVVVIVVVIVIYLDRKQCIQFSLFHD